jgi:hypothetical protein
LLEYREGRGLVLFCQMDVTSRTQTDPAAQTLAWSVLQYASAWQPGPLRRALYTGDAAGRSHLESEGLSVEAYTGQRLSPEHLLILGPNGAEALAARAASIADWLQAGGHLLAVGLDQPSADALPFLGVTMKEAEHVSTAFEPFPADSLLAGIGPADLHNRDPHTLPLIAGGAQVIGNGVLARAESMNVVFCQLVPWQFDAHTTMNRKRTYRRVSFLLSRLLANMGVSGRTPLLERFRRPLAAAQSEQRWLSGFYLDTPEEWDDPYRFFRW